VNVRELIDVLQKMDPDLSVVTGGMDWVDAIDLASDDVNVVDISVEKVNTSYGNYVSPKSGYLRLSAERGKRLNLTFRKAVYIGDRNNLD
jgi:predicted small integral membrane protein